MSKHSATHDQGRSTSSVALRETCPVQNRPDRGTAVIVGASLSGLMAALSLSRVGIKVTLLERSDDTGRTGAALHVENGLLEKITGHRPTEIQPLASGVQTWFTVHAGLKAALEADPNIRFHQQISVLSVYQDASSAWAITSETELTSHYAQASLPQQFDAFVWFDETNAVTPLGPEHARPGVPRTYPFGF